MIPELGTSARGRLDAGVRRHANEDDLLDAALLEVEVEVSISNAVLAPMRLDHDVARLRCQFRMPLTAPGAFCEDGASVGQNLQWARMPPSVIIALAPARVRDVEYCNAYAARGLEECAQMRQQVNRLGDRSDLRPEFAPIAQEIVIRIDEQQAGPVRGIVVKRQQYSPSPPVPVSWGGLAPSR